MSYSDGKEQERAENQTRFKQDIGVLQHSLEIAVTRAVDKHNQEADQQNRLEVRGDPAIKTHLSISNDSRGLKIATRMESNELIVYGVRMENDMLVIDESDGINWVQSIAYIERELQFVGTDADSLAQSFVNGLVEDMKKD